MTIFLRASVIVFVYCFVIAPFTFGMADGGWATTYRDRDWVIANSWNTPMKRIGFMYGVFLRLSFWLHTDCRAKS
jgi:hypothetical protein